MWRIITVEIENGEPVLHAIEVASEISAKLAFNSAVTLGYSAFVLFKDNVAASYRVAEHRDHSPRNWILGEEQPTDYTS